MIDKYIEKILIGTSLEPMTTKKISEVYNIPISICNRKIKMLEKLGLVMCVRKIVSEEDGNTKYYKALEEKIQIKKDNGRYLVRIKVPLDIAIDLRES